MSTIRFGLSENISCSPSPSQLITRPLSVIAANASVEAKIFSTPQREASSLWKTEFADFCPKLPQKLMHPSDVRAAIARFEATSCFTSCSGMAWPPSWGFPQASTEPSVFNAAKALLVATNDTTGTPSLESKKPPLDASPHAVTSPLIKAAQAPSVWCKVIWLCTELTPRNTTAKWQRPSRPSVMVPRCALELLWGSHQLALWPKTTYLSGTLPSWKCNACGLNWIDKSYSKLFEKTDNMNLRSSAPTFPGQTIRSPQPQADSRLSTKLTSKSIHLLHTIIQWFDFNKMLCIALQSSLKTPVGILGRAVTFLQSASANISVARRKRCGQSQKILCGARPHLKLLETYQATHLICIYAWLQSKCC